MHLMMISMWIGELDIFQSFLYEIFFHFKATRLETYVWYARHGKL